MKSDKYEPGISCPHCYDKISEEKRNRLKERQKQIQLAKQRGEAHIGEAAEVQKKHRHSAQDAED